MGYTSDIIYIIVMHVCFWLYCAIHISYFAAANLPFLLKGIFKTAMHVQLYELPYPQQSESPFVTLNTPTFYTLGKWSKLLYSNSTHQTTKQTVVSSCTPPSFLNLKRCKPPLYSAVKNDNEIQISLFLFT